MRFAPYLSEISFAFSKVPIPFTEVALSWSNDGLETLTPSHVEYTSPQSGATLPLFFDNPNPILQLANLPETQALKGALKVAFGNGEVLDNIFVDYLFVAFLTRLTFTFISHEADTSEKLCFAAKISWQIDPLLINRVDHYTIQSAKVIENKIFEIRSETEIVIHSMEPGDTVPITLAAIGFDGLTLGSVSLTLYVPLLKIIPTRMHVDGVGYGKQIDSSGIQETYQVNHNKTIAQMTLPTQQHTAETKSLGKPLSLLNPASVKSSDAKEYVNAFDPNEHNTPFDYSAAKNAGAAIAPQATAILNENHLGNYTLNHQGTLNKTTTVDTYNELVDAPQINNQIDNYQGTFSGDTYSKTVNNYYEQVENEMLNINQHSLEAPTYEENIDQLDEEIDYMNVNSQTILLQGNSFIHNGTLFLNGDFEFCAGSGTPPPAFVQPTKTPNQSIDNDDLALFVATVFGETDLSSFFEYEAGKFYYAKDAVQKKITVTLISQYNERMKYIRYHQKPPFDYPKLHQVDSSDIAIQAVASVIKNRMNNSHVKLCKSIVGSHLQFDCYIDPATLNFNNITETQWNKSNNFIQGYAYLAQNKNSIVIPFLGKNHVQTLMRTDRLLHMLNLIKGIYEGSTPPITNANSYFSPVAQLLTRGEPPNWSNAQAADIMQSGLLKQEDDFYFIVTPTIKKGINK